MMSKQYYLHFLKLWDEKNYAEISKLIGVSRPYLKCVFNADILILEHNPRKHNYTPFDLLRRLYIPYDKNYGAFTTNGDIIMNVSKIKNHILDLGVGNDD